ncbi:MAG: ABC transporter ATP-binding protein, partial [Anaeroplasmataceae bacterium]|nr:ABC transporter ATP-binding protein [Anaeroplasmataceae bacterium]
MVIKELSKTYTSKKKIKTHALNTISLELDSKGLVILSGKSGSGKSTLINILSGLDTSYEGNVIYKGQNLKELSKKELNAYRNSEIGYIFQDFCLLENKTIYENLALSLEIHGSKDDELIHSILNQFDLLDHIHKYPNELSGGEQQRVSIARAILKNPNILIADEPTSSLDEENAKIVLNLLKEISKTKLVIVVTHNLTLAKDYADRIIVLEKGVLLSDTNDTTSIEDTTEENYIPSSKLTHLSFKFMITSILKNIKSKLSYFLFSTLTLVLSLSLVGVSITLESFNENKVVIQSLQNNKEEFLSLKSDDRDIDGFKNKVTDLVKEKFPNQIVEIKSNNTTCEPYFYMSSRFNSIPDIEKEYILSSGYYSGFIALSKENKDLLDYKLLYGSFPKESNEIMITEYMFRSYQAFGFSYEEITKEIHSFDDLSSIPFYIDNTVYKIVGILDTRFNYDHYYLQQKKSGNSTISEEISILNEGIHTAIFVPENFFDAYSLSSVSYTLNQNISISNQSIQIKKDLKDNEVICPSSNIGLCKINFDNNYSKDINIIETCSEDTFYVSEA